MSKNIKEVSTETKAKIQVKESLKGILTLGAIVAEAVAAYVLYFSGNTLSLKIVAAALVVDAGFRATKAFIVIK